MDKRVHHLYACGEDVFYSYRRSNNISESKMKPVLSATYAKSTSCPFNICSKESFVVNFVVRGFLRNGITIFCWRDNWTVLSVIILICVRVCWQMAEVRVYVRYILRFVTIISNWCKFILLVEKQKSVQKEIPHSPQKKKKKKMPMWSNYPALSCFKMERWMSLERFPTFFIILKFKPHRSTVASIGSFQTIRLIVDSN